MSSPTRHVVFGAGPLGRATADALVARGLDVALVSRSARGPDVPGARAVSADLADRTATRAAAFGAAALYFCAQPPYHRWTQEFPPLQTAVIDAARDSGARLIVAENLYCYGPVSEPMTEALPLRPNTRKGHVRAAMNEALMEAHGRGEVDVAVARGSDFFGPGVAGSAVGERLFGAIAAGRPAEVYGDPAQPHSYTFVRDFGEALAILGTDARSSGQVWHVPNAPAVSTEAFVRLAARLVGTAPRLRRVGVLPLRLFGLFVPPAREMIEMLYEFDRPFVVDHAKFAGTFGDISTPLESALSQTLAPWLDSGNAVAA